MTQKKRVIKVDKNNETIYILSNRFTNRLLKNGMGNRMKKGSLASEYLRLNEVWCATNPDIISGNVIKLVGEIYPECESSAAKQSMLMKLTNSSKHTVYAWMNKSRENVKIPLIKLCMIAEALNIDIYNFLVEREMN